jgi:hypothetical protein
MIQVDLLGIAAIAAPFVAKGADVFSKTLGEKLGGLVGDLCHSVADRLKGDASAEKALAGAQEKPDSKIKQAALQAAIAEKMEDDAHFAESIQRLVDAIRKEEERSTFDQRGQTVHDPQTNIAGGVQGAAFSGEFNGPVSMSGEANDFRGSKGMAFMPSSQVILHLWDKIEIHGDGNILVSDSDSTLKGTDMQSFLADLRSIRQVRLDDNTVRIIDEDLQTLAGEQHLNKTMIQSKLQSANGVRVEVGGSVEMAEQMQKQASSGDDTIIVRSVTKNFFPNMITINSNDYAFEDITIEITLPTKRCCIGADVALAIDCSANMYHSDRDRTMRKRVAESIISRLRRDSDRISLLYLNNNRLNMQRITNDFDLVRKNIDKSLSSNYKNIDKGRTNFNELLKGAMDSIYADNRDSKPYTRSVIILSNAEPFDEDVPYSLRFNSDDMKIAIKENESKYGGKKIAFYSVGINQHPLGRPILEEIAGLNYNAMLNHDFMYNGIFVPIEKEDLNAINENMKAISCRLIEFEELSFVKIIDTLPPFIKEPHDFRVICKTINQRIINKTMTPVPILETNSQNYATTITWDLGTIQANGDIWRFTYKARIDFSNFINIMTIVKESNIPKIMYNDANGNKHKILIEPAEMRIKTAID